MVMPNYSVGIKQMPERKVVSLIPIPQHGIYNWEFLKEVGDIHYWKEYELKPLARPSREEYIENLKTLRPHAVVGRIPRFTGEMMDLDDRLEWIFTLSQGFNQIDVEAATERGIMVSNSGGTPETGHGISELAWAHILAVARRLPQLDEAMRSGEKLKPAVWADQRYARSAPILWGKTLGIIGLGLGGSVTAITGRLGFNMRVIAYDPYVTRSQAHLMGAELVDLDTLCKESDVIAVHCVLNDETRGMIGERQFKLMKPTAIIVNDARGAIIDMPALAKALEEERIYGAGIDVWPDEPPNPDDGWVQSLQQSRRTSLSAHGGNVRESLAARHTDAMNNVVRFCTGKDPLWVVNPIVIWRKRLLAS